MNQAPTIESTRSGSADRTLLAGLLVSAVAIAAHLRGLHGEFVYDDLELVLANPAITSWAGLLGAFSSAFWDFTDADSSALIGYWRPLTYAALFLGRLLGGGAPWGFHALSIGLHAAAACCALRLASRLFSAGSPGCDARSNAWFAALATGLLFALHPVQVESVAWISAVSVPLSGALGLAFLGSWLAWRQRGSRGLPLAALAWLLAALLARETSAALLPLALALDLLIDRRGPEPRSHPPAARRTGWLWLSLAALLYLGLRMAVFHSPWAGLDRETTDIGASFARLLSLRVEVLGELLGLALWPHPLSVFREVQPARPDGDPGLWIALGLLGAWLTLIAVLALRSRTSHDRSAAFAAVCTPLALLVVVARIESLGRCLVSDRFLYLPVFGVVALLGLALSRLPRTGGLLGLLALASLLGWRTWERSAVWQSEVALYESEVRAHPDSVYVQCGVGRVHLRLYRETGDYAHVQRALTAYQSVAELHDRIRDTDRSLFASPYDFLQANIGLGWCYYYEAVLEEVHEYETAEAIFRATLEKFPDSHEAYCGLAAALWRLDRIPEAREAFGRALELDPLSWETWWNLGRLERHVGDSAAELRAFERASELRPDDLGTRLELAAAQANSGDRDRARELFEELLGARFAPPSARVRAHVGLGDLEAAGGNFEGALAHYDEALALDRAHAAAWLQRGQVLLALQQPAEAILAMRTACELDPTNFRAHYNLATLLVRASQFGLAIEVYEHALSLDPPAELAGPIEAELERLRAL